MAALAQLSDMMFGMLWKTLPLGLRKPVSKTPLLLTRARTGINLDLNLYTQPHMPSSGLAPKVHRFPESCRMS